MSVSPTTSFGAVDTSRETGSAHYIPYVGEDLTRSRAYVTTLGDLLGFMQSFNLRFAPANSFRQRQIYQKLYPMFAEQTNGTPTPTPTPTAAGTAEKPAGDAIGGLKSAATDLFKDQ